MNVQSTIACGRESIQRLLVSVQSDERAGARLITDLVDRVMEQIAREEALLDEPAVRAALDEPWQRAAYLRARLALLRLLTWRDDPQRAARSIADLTDVFAQREAELMDAASAALDESARRRVGHRIAQLTRASQCYVPCDFVRALPLREDDVDRVA